MTASPASLPADAVFSFQTPTDDGKDAQTPFVHRAEDLDIDVSRGLHKRGGANLCLTGAPRSKTEQTEPAV